MRRFRWIGWWVPPLLLGLLASRMPLLRSGDPTASSFQDCRVHLVDAAFAYMLAVGIGRSAVAQLQAQRPREEGRGFPVIVHPEAQPPRVLIPAAGTDCEKVGAARLPSAARQSLCCGAIACAAWLLHFTIDCVAPMRHDDEADQRRSIFLIIAFAAVGLSWIGLILGLRSLRRSRDEFLPALATILNLVPSLAVLLSFFMSMG